MKVKKGLTLFYFACVFWEQGAEEIGFHIPELW